MSVAPTPSKAVAEPLFNIASALPVRAERHPQRKAIVFPENYNAGGKRCYSHLTYEQLDRRCDQFAHALKRQGISRGHKILLMVRPGPDFVSLSFALFKIGAVPVLIDPGMGRSNLKQSIAQIQPDGLVGIPLAQLFRVFNRKAFRTARYTVTVGGRRWLWGGGLLERMIDPSDGHFPVAETRSTDPAAILFTTGSTGPPKGVTYQHGMFRAQVEMIREHYGIQEQEVDLPAFPLFVLFSVAWGTTSIIPDMDPSRPAQVEPAKIVEAIQDHGVTYTFGSPAIWRRVGVYCAERGLTLPSVRRILMAGAPVPEQVLRPFQQILGPQADTHTPYGATEALPLCSLHGREILQDTAVETRQGAGVCVGKPLPQVTLRIIRIDDGTIDLWDDRLCLPQGEIGEIVVKGPPVTQEYHLHPEQTRQAKIAEGDQIWHRMGDLGYLDRQGRLWVCGRKAHRVKTDAGPLYTIPCEAIFNQHPAVLRSALVGVGTRAVIIIELERGHSPSDELSAELLELARAADHTRSIGTVLYHPCFPVDIRHNAKIFREKLTLWAEERLG